MVIHGIYYGYISKNWFPFHVAQFSILTVVLFCQLLVPESPQYLYANKRFDDCRESLDYIAKFNGKAMKSVNFDTEGDQMEESPAQIKLKGNISEVLKIWQLRRNMFVQMALLLITNFSFF